MLTYLKRFCVYSHSVDGAVFYIGKGRAHRAFKRHNRNAEWRKLVSQLEAIEIKILAWFESEQDAILYEAKLIRKLKPKCNLILNGFKRSPEHIEAIRAANAGCKKTETTLARMSATQRLLPNNRKPLKELTSGRYFNSRVKACRELHFTTRTLRDHLSGSIDNIRGMKFIEADKVTT